MTNSPRFLPVGGALVEVTCRTAQSRHLLRPGRKLNRLIEGVLARACNKYPVEIVTANALSNHLHLALKVSEQEHLTRFMQFVNSNIARGVNRLRGRRGPFWDRRYQSITVTHEEAAQVARLRYLLAQGVKEGLVRRVRHWPGVHFGKTLEKGSLEVAGTWIDRTRLIRAKHHGKELRTKDVEENHLIRLAKLPCWEDLRDEEYCREVRSLVRAIEQEAAETRRQAGRSVLGRRRILRVDPESAPKESKNSPAPRVHAASQAARREFLRARAWFVEAYREACSRLKRGESPRFPAGCFPPGLPYVRAGGVPG